jgi:hypothetical protein
LCRWKVFPDNWYAQHKLAMTFRYPWARNLIISRRNIEINHVCGYTQRIGIHWVKTGFGKPRPIFVCRCGYGVHKLFLRYGFLACRHCHGAAYASQQRDSNGRKRLAASKLRLKLGGCPDITEPMPAKPRLTRRRTYQHIRNEIQSLEAKVKTTRFKQHLNSQLFAYHLG